MGFPSQILIDFNFNKSTKLLPYWVFKYFLNKTDTPIFINELVDKNIFLGHKNYLNWSYFLKKNFNNQNTFNKLTAGNLNLLSTFKVSKNNSNSYTVENLVNINFLRHERLYTKLKYSRSPAFDSVSGGAAAILAGFLGFLISEKFGFELVDSGDFYYLWMYIVFLVFMLKPLLYTMNVNSSVYSTLSINNILNFFIKISLMVILFVKSKFNGILL